MAKETATFELKEPAPPGPLLPTDPSTPLWLGLIAMLVATAALGAYFLWRKRRSRHLSPQALRLQAYHEAQTALSQASTPTARSAAIQASLILRRFLAAAAMDPSLYETHEEFVTRSDSLKILTEQARAACHTGFATLAAVKYSPQESATPPATLMDGARGLLETLHLGFND